MSGNESRFGRQEELVPRQMLAELQVSVIGVGGIGRQVALQLASTGVRRLQLVDFDNVENTNITTQGYLASDMGESKVIATARAIQRLDSEISVELVDDRYRPKLQLGPAVFCCVDAISARSAIWRTVGRSCRFWCDGRMLAEVIRVLTVADEQTRHHYPTTLFRQDAAHTGRCTARGTIYTASIAAGLMLHQYCRWLRNLPVDPDLTLNLLASELIAAQPAPCHDNAWQVTAPRA